MSSRRGGVSVAGEVPGVNGGAVSSVGASTAEGRPGRGRLPLPGRQHDRGPSSAPPARANGAAMGRTTMVARQRRTPDPATGRTAAASIPSPVPASTGRSHGRRHRRRNTGQPNASGRHRGASAGTLVADDQAQASWRSGDRITPIGLPHPSTHDDPSRSRSGGHPGREARPGGAAPSRARLDRQAALRRHRPAPAPPGDRPSRAPRSSPACGWRVTWPPRCCSRWARR